MVLFEKGPVNLYHGFDQPNIMDRQEFKLLFEHGDITLHDWVPTKLKINALLTKKQLDGLAEIVKPDKIKFKKYFAKTDSITKSRLKSYTPDFYIEMSEGYGRTKGQIYQQVVKDLFIDQINWLKDKKHVRKITDENAVNSVKMATIAYDNMQRF